MARTSRAEMAYRTESILRSTFSAMFDPAPGERRPRDRLASRHPAEGTGRGRDRPGIVAVRDSTYRRRRARPDGGGRARTRFVYVLVSVWPRLAVAVAQMLI